MFNVYLVSKSDSMVNYERTVRASSEETFPILENISEKMTSVEITKVEKGRKCLVCFAIVDLVPFLIL